MEYPLTTQVADVIYEGHKCLNPYSNGIPSDCLIQKNKIMNKLES